MKTVTYMSNMENLKDKDNAEKTTTTKGTKKVTKKTSPKAKVKASKKRNTSNIIRARDCIKLKRRQSFKKSNQKHNIVAVLMKISTVLELALFALTKAEEKNEKSTSIPIQDTLGKKVNEQDTPVE